MAEQRYRFGGPIPESVQRLRDKRRFRSSSLFARMKRANGEKFRTERSGAVAQGSSPLGEELLRPPSEFPPAG